MPEDPELIRVFISYSHDSDLLTSQVLFLADELNKKGGISCSLDQYELPAPKEGWPQWMTYQVHHADYILMVCTQGYFDKFFRKNKADAGSGGINECLLITNKFNNASSASNSYIPILFGNGKKDHIPVSFSGQRHYQLENPEGWDEAQFNELYFHITGQAATPAPEPNTTIQKRPHTERGKFPTTPKAGTPTEEEKPVDPSGNSKQESSPAGPSEETRAVVCQRILEILKKHPKFALIDDLRNELKKADHYDETRDVIQAVAEGLVHRTPLESIQLLIKAKKKNQRALRASGTVADQQENFNMASDLLGWLTLLCINHQWLDSHQAFFRVASLNSKISIPSSTKVGASTAYSGTVPRKTQLVLDDVSKEPISEVDIYLDYFQETGFRKEFTLQSILEVVYSKIWKDVPFKLNNVPSLEVLKKELSPIINVRDEDESQPVLFLNLKPEKGNPIENSAIFVELREALGTMPVFFLKTDQDLKALIVEENLLQNLIIEFYLD